MEIISWAEAKQLGLKTYFTGKPCPKNHIAMRRITGACLQCQSEYFSKYSKTRPGRTKNDAARWRKANPLKFNEGKLDWYKRNPHKFAEYNAKRKAAKLRATPLWADMKAIGVVYQEAAKKGLHVDHVLPLQGETVSGLHVANNLQLLTKAENSAKGNSFSEVWL